MMQQLMKMLGLSVQEQVQAEGEWSCVQSDRCPDLGENTYCNSHVCDTYNECC